MYMLQSYKQSVTTTNDIINIINIQVTNACRMPTIPGTKHYIRLSKVYTILREYKPKYAESYYSIHCTIRIQNYDLDRFIKKCYIGYERIHQSVNNCM